MSLFFTNLAKNELKPYLLYDPVEHGFRPFQGSIDFSWALLSIAIVPAYFLLLGCLVVIESLLSIMQVAYYYLKSNHEKVNLYLLESKESGVIGLQALCMVIGIAVLLLVIFLFRLFATFILPVIKNNGLSQHKSSEKSLPDVAKSLSKYADLIENAGLEIGVINDALRAYSMDARAFFDNKEDLQQEKRCTRQSISSFALSHFQISKEEIAILRQQAINEELINEYQELVSNYPLFTIEGSVVVSDIELACTALEAHHLKVLNAAELVLPNLYSLLNMEKQMDTPNSSTMKV